MWPAGSVATKPEIRTWAPFRSKLGGVHQTATPLLTTEPGLWRPYLALVFDGIRADATRPLPHPAPDMLRFVETDPPPGA
jgi:hypothetical protein